MSEKSVIYITNSIFTSRTYIISSEDSNAVWLVDCGDVDKILERIGEKTVKGIFLTHAHFDHIYGLPELLEKFPSCVVVSNNYGFRTLANDRMNMSRYHGMPVVDEPANRMIVSEGDSIDLFDDVKLKVYETPGHHPSCLTFELGDYLFTGDAYIPGCEVVTLFSGADKVQAKNSVNRILNLAEGKLVMSGHEI